MKIDGYRSAPPILRAASAVSRLQGAPADDKLANGVLEIYGVSRGQKWRALKELEALGLIRVEHCERKSPRVTVLHPAQDARC
jgi:hypothetical protein